MDTDQVKTICEDRLWGWKNKLVSEHATPVVLVGVGHDHKKGQVVVVTTEEMSNAEIRLFLASAIKLLEKAEK